VKVTNDPDSIARDVLTLTSAPSDAARTRWGARAAALYTEAYAEQYRAYDESIRPGQAAERLGRWLHDVCARFDRPIDILDLGCGTGRYFHAVANARRLVGIDASRAMLDRARHPVGNLTSVPGVTLVEGDFLIYDFQSAEFDLVYSIGVLAEHSPFNEALASRVKRWLRSGGRFAFTTVHPESASVPRTLKRRVGGWVLPLARRAPASMRRGLRARLMSEGLYADEERVREVLGAAGLAVESVGPFESDVHLHVLAVGRKGADDG
jgi:SAM-dependent methyltransferase